MLNDEPLTKIFVINPLCENITEENKLGIGLRDIAIQNLKDILKIRVLELSEVE